MLLLCVCRVSVQQGSNYSRDLLCSVLTHLLRNYALYFLKCLREQTFCHTFLQKLKQCKMVQSYEFFCLRIRLAFSHASFWCEKRIHDSVVSLIKCNILFSLALMVDNGFILMLWSWKQKLSFKQCCANKWTLFMQLPLVHISHLGSKCSRGNCDMLQYWVS